MTSFQARVYEAYCVCRISVIFDRVMSYIKYVVKMKVASSHPCATHRGGGGIAPYSTQTLRLKWNCGHCNVAVALFPGEQ